MKNSRTLIILVAMILFPMALAACGGGGPQERSFTIEFQEGSTAETPPTFTVNQGDTVTLTLETDTEATFHLHGYDIENEVAPGQQGEMTFMADATGRFPIEIEETETEVAFLEVRPR